MLLFLCFFFLRYATLRSSTFLTRRTQRTRFGPILIDISPTMEAHCFPTLPLSRYLCAFHRYTVYETSFLPMRLRSSGSTILFVKSFQNAYTCAAPLKSQLLLGNRNDLPRGACNAVKLHIVKRCLFPRDGLGMMR